MFFTILYFDDLNNNFLYYNEFINLINKIKGHLKLNFYNNKQFFLHTIIKSTFDYQNSLFLETIIKYPNIPIVLFALIKKIVLNWIDNINYEIKYFLNISILYLAFNDYCVFYDIENEDLTYPIYDGNISCDKNLILQMLHIIISLTICAINVNYPILKPETYKILVNYRCGIIINQSKEEIVDYIFHTYNINTQEYNFFIYPEFKNNKNYNIDSYIFQVKI